MIILSETYLICSESFLPPPSLSLSLSFSLSYMYLLSLCFSLFLFQHPFPSPLFPSFLSSFPLSPQTIYRARFSSITEQAILHAFHNLATPNWNEARSVDARMELDLRIGCSFTRFQTTLFQVCRKQIQFISCSAVGLAGSVVYKQSN